MLTWTDILQLADNGNLTPPKRVVKTETEWRSLLTEEQFRVTRRQGTEQAFSSESCARFEPGAYDCVCCGASLFDATEKFDSGSGWPSFTQPAVDTAVAYHKDNAHGMQRIEATCGCCAAHLGHVFPDGPAPSGLRYCINAVSMKKT